MLQDTDELAVEQITLQSLTVAAAVHDLLKLVEDDVGLFVDNG